MMLQLCLPLSLLFLLLLFISLTISFDRLFVYLLPPKNRKSFRDFFPFWAPKKKGPNRRTSCCVLYLFVGSAGCVMMFSLCQINNQAGSQAAVTHLANGSVWRGDWQKKTTILRLFTCGGNMKLYGRFALFTYIY